MRRGGLIALEEQKYLSVTQLNAEFNEMLQSQFPSVSFRGEISQCTRAASGHLYFTVKDEKSQLSGVMWRGMASKLAFEPKQGVEVLCDGKPNIYGGSGKFQVVVHRMQEAGEGLLQRRFLELKAKLQREGLFEDGRKRALPSFPKRVGIVTSKTGAAVHDIMKKIAERMPSTEVFLYPARVQGEGAADEVVAGIRYFQERHGIEVLIVGRGGGSLEDLWCFNEEVVVREIFASRIPVISAVGHEVDVTLSDLVADCRAPTPTAAGEMVVPRRQDLLQELDRAERSLKNYEQWFYPYAQRMDELAEGLRQNFRYRLQYARSGLEQLRGDLARLRPDRFLRDQHQRGEALFYRLRDGIRRRLLAESDQLLRYQQSLERKAPHHTVRSYRERLEVLERRLAEGSRRRVQEERHRLRGIFEVMQALNCERVLERGYSLVRSGDRVVKSAVGLQGGDLLDITFAEGAVRAAVAGEKRQTAPRATSRPTPRPTEKSKQPPHPRGAEKAQGMLFPEER
ncbi:exodeoxyribonuclease VII large subunit [bacterium]|nr:exodeoxyribonuclease VII large subunit [bacterium]